jgi:uncharacterized protein (DUF1697 family)
VTRYALLLRGVNVGGHRRLAMTDLKAVLTGLGHTDVGTYLQSGNAVLTARRISAAALEAQVQEALAAELGVRTRVLARPHARRAAVVQANPFPAAAAEKPAWLHVAFLSAAPDAKAADALDPAAFAPDEFALGDEAVYLRFVTSPARSRMPAAVTKAVLRDTPDAVATARNWNTVVRLAELTGP